MVKGDIYLANIYFSDSSESKIRPILLLKENSYSDFLFLPLTTNLDVPGFKLDNTHLAEGLLPKTSIVVCERIGVIAKNLLTRKIAKLDITTQQQIITELINFITE